MTSMIVVGVFTLVGFLLGAFVAILGYAASKLRDGKDQK